MKIAKAQGDLFGMNDLYASYYTAFSSHCDSSNPPKEEFRGVCNIDCHVQLAEYHLFEAGDMEYYLSKAVGNGSPALLKPEQLAAHVLAGVALVESASILLSRSNTSTDFRDYLQALGHINILKAKLYMASGDAWYKAVSEKRVARLAYLTTKAIDLDQADPPPGFPIAGASMLQEAAAGYDAALWGLNEALMEIPDEHYFDALTLEATKLVRELQARRDSLARGLIFVGIDPDDYSLISIPNLKSRLQEAAASTKALESQIDSVLKAYFANAKQIQDANVNNQQALAAQSIGVSSYKVASLENLADRQRQELTSSIDLLNSANTGYEKEYRRADLAFTMQRQLAEAQNKLDRLKGTQEVDTLNFQAQQVVQRINDLQWVLNQDVSTTGLLLQLDTLNSTFVTFDRDVEKARYEKEQVAQRILRARADIQSAQRAIANDQGEIQRLEARRGPIFAASYHGAAANICSVEAKLLRLKGPAAIPQPFSWVENGATQTCASLAQAGGISLDPNLGTQASYIQKRCDAKTVLNQLNMTTAADALICVLGADALPPSIKSALTTYLRDTKTAQDITQYEQAHCETFKQACQNLFDASSDVSCDKTFASARALYGERLKLAQQQRTAARNLLDTLTQIHLWMIQEIETETSLRIKNASAWEAERAALAAAQDAAAKLPKVTTGTLAGPMGGGIMLDFSWMSAVPAAQAAATAAKEVHEAVQTAQTWTQYVFSVQQKISEMGLQIQKAEQALAQAEVGGQIEKYQTAQALMELSGRSLDFSSRLAAALAEIEDTSLDCNNQAAALNAEVASLQLEHESLMAQADVTLQENDLFAIDIQRNTRLIQTSNASIANLNSQITEFSLELEELQQEIDAINGTDTLVGLRQRTQAQVDKLSALLGRLHAASDEVHAMQSVRDTLQSDLFKKTTALNATEIEYLQTILSDNVSYTKDMLSRIDTIEATDESITTLKSQLNNIYQQVYAAVASERTNMLCTAEQAYAGTAANPVEQIYLTNDELAANLTKGIPDYLQEKRALLESANYQLGLLYTRIRALTSAVTPDAVFGIANDSAPLSYARTGQDIQDALDSASGDVFRNQALIQTEVVGIDILSTSGLGRQLQLERSAEFEITPAAKSHMAEVGYFGLWHRAFNEANALTVLDMRLLVVFAKVGCMEREFKLTHQGSGFRFVGRSGGGAEPLLVAAPPRTVPLKYYRLDSEITEFNNAWKPLMSLLGFWNNEVQLSYDRETLLPFLGVPVIGAYRVELPEALNENSGDSTCTYDNASFRLVVAYALAASI